MERYIWLILVLGIGLAIRSIIMTKTIDQYIAVNKAIKQMQLR